MEGQVKRGHEGQQWNKRKRKSRREEKMFKGGIGELSKALAQHVGRKRMNDKEKSWKGQGSGQDIQDGFIGKQQVARMGKVAHNGGKCHSKMMAIDVSTTIAMQGKAGSRGKLSVTTRTMGGEWESDSNSGILVNRVANGSGMGKNADGMDNGNGNGSVRLGCMVGLRSLKAKVASKEAKNRQVKEQEGRTGEMR